MGTKHTPGPWITEIAGSDSPARVLAPNGCGQGCPCEVAGSVMPEDARLIAAAPDLLAACRELVAEFDREEAELMEKPGYYGMNETEGVAIARAALAKAGAL